MRQLGIHDTLSGDVVPVEPHDGNRIGIYACGPTVYGRIHVGNARPFVVFSLLKRFLEHEGYDATLVVNVTDVNDKIYDAARERGVPSAELAREMTAAYVEDTDRLELGRPDAEPRATETIDAIIALIADLVESGHAYERGGDVYFRVSSFEGYGKLSNRPLDEMQQGEGDDAAELKESPQDFALWKARKEGEDTWWESPWGKGRPGWHIECSAMTVAHLGTSFDLHGGGKDLIFPHHENEIAQSQGADGPHTFARYWLHNGLIVNDGVKLSKSLGDALLCARVIRAVGAEALRWYFVSHHFRSTIDLELELVNDAEGHVVGARYHRFEAADKKLDYFYTTLKRIDDFLATGGEPPAGAVLPAAETLIPGVRDA
ncbi:MAG: cysteine--tRNA ligase, partial [Thermoleophilaceae bacterium]